MAAYHWRLGRIGMLTGDDKSTWFWDAAPRMEADVCPDVVVYCLEKLPRQGFLRQHDRADAPLFRNMARNNSRAFRLGPGCVGWFTWLVLLDQRISPWTSLWGPVSALALGLFYDKERLGDLRVLGIVDPNSAMRDNRIIPVDLSPAVSHSAIL